MIKLPDSVNYFIIGASVHGLSADWYLAKELKSRGIGTGKDILVKGGLHPVSNSPYPWG